MALLISSVFSDIVRLNSPKIYSLLSAWAGCVHLLYGAAVCELAIDSFLYPAGSKAQGRVDEGLRNSASFTGGSGLSCLFLDFIECQTSLDLISNVFCLCWATCRYAIVLPLLKYYGGCSEFKNIFNIFSLLSPYPLFSPNFLRLVSTLDDCPFPVISLCAY